MAYVQETCICGDVIEVRKYQDFLHGRRNFNRSRKKEKTPERMQAINRKNAVTKLRRKLNTGCRPGDYHMVLTYEGEPPEPEAAEKELKKYLDRLRVLYKKHGFDLRWLAVTEYQNKRIHHHLILNQGPDLLAICGKWKKGRPKVTLLDQSGQYGALAEYLIKETDKTFRDPKVPQSKRWRCSRNWPEPIIKKEVVRRKRWMEEPRVRKGYIIETDKTVNGWTDDGYPYQFYSMIKIKKE